MNVPILVQAYRFLVKADLAMRMGAFEAVQTMLRRQAVFSVDPSLRVPVATTCHAVDLAAAFYFKPVLCLQSSAATTILLRRHGWNAALVIGVQLLPFKSHAWVEVNDEVVNDRPYIRDRYRVLDRCGAE
jgi:hypothetical protein